MSVVLEEDVREQQERQLKGLQEAYVVGAARAKKKLASLLGKDKSRLSSRAGPPRCHSPANRIGWISGDRHPTIGCSPQGCDDSEFGQS